MCNNLKKIIVNKEEVTVKCGKCLQCQREKNQEWAIKLINESKYHKKSSFITLTFDNKILLDKNSKAVKYGANSNFIFHIENSKIYFQKFIKRLRKKVKKKISFFHIAEYGEKNKRPHHHAIIFGYNFENDRIEMEKSKSGKTQYWSKELSDLWACGRVSIQDLNANNTIYICQYSFKKSKNSFMNEKDEKDKNIKKYKPKMTFSNRSKISTKWVRRNHEEIIKGFIEDTDGKKYRIPKSYINNLKKEDINSKYGISYRQYQEKLYEMIGKKTDKELKEKAKIKEEILKQRIKLNQRQRDFE